MSPAASRLVLWLGVLGVCASLPIGVSPALTHAPAPAPVPVRQPPQEPATRSGSPHWPGEGRHAAAGVTDEDAVKNNARNNRDILRDNTSAREGESGNGAEEDAGQDDALDDDLFIKYGDVDDEKLHGVVSSDDPDSDDDAMVYLYLQGPATHDLSWVAVDEQHFPGDIKQGSTSEDHNHNTAENTGAAHHSSGDGSREESDHKESGIGFPYLPDDDEYGPRRGATIVLTDEQLEILDSGDKEHQGTLIIPVSNEYHHEINALYQDIPFQLISSTDEQEEAPESFPELATTSPAAHQVTDGYITQQELDEILREYEGFIVTESVDEEWEPERDEGTSSDELDESSLKHGSHMVDGDKAISKLMKHESIPAPETSELRAFVSDEALDSGRDSNPELVPFVNLNDAYRSLVQSDQVNAEEKLQIASLERLRRTIDTLGGFEALQKPRVHHVVKRQLQGEQACGGVLNKRRRRRRGVRYVGKNLEQGNPRFKQLLNQYRKMCSFIAMAVFDK